MKRFLLLFLTMFLIYACTSSGEEDPLTTDNFDRKVMLTHIADNIIIPSYEDFTSKMESLNSVGTAFSNNPTQTTLEDLRGSWLEAYKSWQHVEMYNTGFAEELGFNFFMNIYPLTVSDVEQNITNGTYDLNSPNNHDAQGFPALDYLLYGVGTGDEEILSKYTTAAHNNNYKNYLTDVLQQMNTLTKEVVAQFKANRDAFVNSAENTATSSVNKLINDYIFYYEKGLRRNKIGIPAGFFSNTPFPDKVEAYYRKDISKILALEALTAVQDVFVGHYFGTANANRSGFKDYLIALNREDLATAIENQFEVAKTQINNLEDDFSSQIISNNAQMLKTRDELQKAVILLKVDMLQAFNISVDYVDADGD
ncbi:MAG: putative lipoprotein [Polaribacter sp.]|jgi:predicted lipoprotein